MVLNQGLLSGLKHVRFRFNAIDSRKKLILRSSAHDKNQKDIKVNQVARSKDLFNHYNRFIDLMAVMNEV